MVAGNVVLVPDFFQLVVILFNDFLLRFIYNLNLILALFLGGDCVAVAENVLVVYWVVQGLLAHVDLP